MLLSALNVHFYLFIFDYYKLTYANERMIQSSVLLRAGNTSLQRLGLKFCLFFFFISFMSTCFINAVTMTTVSRSDLSKHGLPSGSVLLEMSVQQISATMITDLLDVTVIDEGS